MKVIKIPFGVYLEKDIILSIAKRLKREEIGILPTDTIYGFHSRFDSEKCIDRLNKIKNRDGNKKYLILIDDYSFFEKFEIELKDNIKSLLEVYWPGQLTLLFKGNEKFPPWCMSSEGKIGVRMPGLPLLREIIRECGVPLISTSVNKGGELPLTNIEEIILKFGGFVDFVVDFGNLEVTSPSTVLDVSSDDFKVIREGVVPSSLLKTFFEEN